MYTIKLVQFADGIFSVRHADTQELRMLGDFLAGAVSGYDFIKKDLARSPKSDSGLNMYLAERENELVTISNLIIEGEPEFKIPYDKFIKLVDDWLIVCRQLPKEIIITTQDQINFAVTGKSNE